MPSVHCTAITQLKAYRTRLLYPQRNQRKKEGKTEREERKKERQCCSKEQNYLFFLTRLNRHKSCLSDPLNLPSCFIFPLISRNCNTLRQSFVPLVNCTLQLKIKNKGRRPHFTQLKVTQFSGPKMYIHIKFFSSARRLIIYLMEGLTLNELILFSSLWVTSKFEISSQIVN